VALAREHLAEGIADVDDPDVGGVDLGRGQRAVDDLSGQGREVAALFRQVASEITLVAPENPHTSRAIHRPHGTPG
jgi:hypothetical protein